jgi:hypothetical protein
MVVSQDDRCRIADDSLAHQELRGLGLGWSALRREVVHMDPMPRSENVGKEPTSAPAVLDMGDPRPAVDSVTARAKGGQGE